MTHLCEVLSFCLILIRNDKSPPFYTHFINLRGIICLHAIGLYFEITLTNITGINKFGKKPNEFMVNKQLSWWD